MVELLAPAGDFESLRAAVLNGANAVYIGGKNFSARQYANNFDNEEMIEAVKFCHAYNVKLYVTLNTLLANSELKEAVEYASFLYESGVDAVIIQDIGFLRELKTQLPGLELHASTQMTAHNLDTVNLLYSMGVKRVVLSRELSIEEIRHIKQNTQAELEIFVHGALCISFSGQCLFSSMIGGRSGNRGKCAQPCRMEYSIDGGERAYYLSPKDLSTLDFILDVINTGVVSLKIEGRMKRPEYVATVVSSYRRAMDGKSRPDDMERVTQAFNRGGFTTGYFLERQGVGMMSHERPKNWGTYLGRVVSARGKFTSILLERDLMVGDGVEIFKKNIGAPVSSIRVDERESESAKKGDIVTIFLEGAQRGDVIYKSLDIALVKEAEESYKGKDVPRAPLRGSFFAHLGRPITLNIETPLGIIVEATGDEPERAMKTPTSQEKIKDSLGKTGDTPFYFEIIDFDMEEDLAIPVSKINSLRRDGIEKLLELLQNRREHKNVNVIFNKHNEKRTPKICVTTGREDLARASIDAGCDTVYFGGDRLRINSGDIKGVIKHAEDRAEVFPWFPEIIMEEYDRQKDLAGDLKGIGIRNALCGNPGFYRFLMDEGYDVMLDRGLNIFNSKAADALYNSGCVLSPELNLKQMRDLISYAKSSPAVQVHGRIKLMVNRNCTYGASRGHGKSGCPNLCGTKPHSLRDRMGEEFLLATDYYCRSHVYNSKILCTIEHMKDIMGLNVSAVFINLLDEDEDTASLVVRAYREAVDMAVKGEYEITDVSRELLDRLKGNITKGHFYRGVQ